MWSGRFREPLDPLFDHWQRSIKFDRALLVEETLASKAHALALLGAGILTAGEQEQIAEALDTIVQRFHPQGGSHKPESMDTVDAEDIHHLLSSC